MARLVERMQHYVFSGGPSTPASARLFPPPNSHNGILDLTAVTPGAAGNNISIQVIIAGNDTPFSLSVSGLEITVNSATDGGGLGISLTEDVAAAINAYPPAAALVMAFSETTGEYVASFAQTFLTGGIGSQGQVGEGVSLHLDPEAPFRLYGVCVWNLGVPEGDGYDGQIALRFARPDGRLVQSVITASNLLFPGNRYNIPGLSPNKAMVCPIRPSILYPANGIVQFDITGLPTSASTLGAIIVLIGTKIFNEGGVWAPTYPQRFKARNYTDNVTVQDFNPLNGPLMNNIFTAQQDADFVWQGGAYSDFPTGSSGATDLCQLVDLGVIVKDYTYKAYSNGYVPAGLLFPFLGAEMQGIPYPEIYIPTQQQLLFDLNYLYPGFTPGASPVTVVLGLKGMKVYPQG